MNDNMSSGSGWTTSTLDAKSSIESLISQRDTSRYQDGIGDVKFVGYSVVGINGAKIDVIRNKIQDYVNSIEKYLDDMNPLADANQAFKSEEVQTAVSNYIKKVKDYCINLTSQLLIFSDKLADVREAYQQNMTKLQSNIDDLTGRVSEGTKYTTIK